MKGIDDLADSLTTEILVEMADSFFGARKAIDEEKERFEIQASAVKAIGEATLGRLVLLHGLLLDEEHVRDFYLSLGVTPDNYLRLVRDTSDTMKISIPFALTRKKRYAKLLIKAYGEAAGAVRGYLHGEYYNDPKVPGRKRLTPSFELLSAWAEKINASVKKVNENHSPSSVLSFSKSLNGAQVRHESISEATIDGYSNTLDKSLAIHPLDFQAYGLKEFPELPPLESAGDQVVNFARRLYKQHEERINALLEHLKT